MDLKRKLSRLTSAGPGTVGGRTETSRGGAEPGDLQPTAALPAPAEAGPTGSAPATLPADPSTVARAERMSRQLSVLRPAAATGSTSGPRSSSAPSLRLTTTATETPHGTLHLAETRF